MEGPRERVFFDLPRRVTHNVTHMEPRRCWPSGDDPLMDRYHDQEWGVPAHDDRRHFEYLILDAFQAGLSWRTILHRREGFRAAFAGFDPRKVARFGARDVRRLLGDVGIIRNRQKIAAAIGNAKAFLAVQEAEGSFDRYIWRFTEGRVIVNRWKTLKELPAKTAVSDAMSADLMQAAGLVNDHLVGCPVRRGARPGAP
jgi:DNA-3-methyladenine glycosylase I